MALKNAVIKKYPLLGVIRTGIVWATLLYLRFFARISLLFFKGKSIGIAGAVGKSTTRYALNAILSPYKPTCEVTGNSETGIPLGVLGLDIGRYTVLDFIRVIVLAPLRIFYLQSYEFLIVEMGIDGPKAPKNMEYLLTIIKPDIGILVNESPAHVANYEAYMGDGSITERLENVVQFMMNDDGKLVTQPRISTAILNGDDPYIQKFSEKVPKQVVRTVGKDKHHDISLSHHEITDTATTFEFSVHSFQEKEDLIFTFPNMVLPEEAGVAIGSAILAALAVNVPLLTITHNLNNYFSLPPGRGTIFRGIHESTIFDSTYNASSASVVSFLQIMKSFSTNTRRPTFFVFGDMKELGTFSEYEHGQVAKVLPESVTHLVLVGPLTKELVLPTVRKHEKKFQTLVHFPTAKEAGEYLKTHLPEKALILLKGSQLLEETIKFILKDKKDVQKLCRQDSFWKNAKKKNGAWIDIN